MIQRIYSADTAFVGKTAGCKIHSWKNFREVSSSLLRRILLPNSSETDTSFPGASCSVRSCWMFSAPKPAQPTLPAEEAAGPPQRGAAPGPARPHRTHRREGCAQRPWPSARPRSSGREGPARGLEPCGLRATTAATAEGRRWPLREGRIPTDSHPGEPNCFSLNPVNHSCQWHNPATPLQAAQVRDEFGNKTWVSQIPVQHIHHLMEMAQKSYTKPYFMAARCKNSFWLTLMSLFSPNPSAAALRTWCCTCDITFIAMETECPQLYQGLLKMQISINLKVYTNTALNTQHWEQSRVSWL